MDEEELKAELETTIKMRITIDSKMEQDSFDFNKTEILVALSQLGSERYISRSQAKKILKNLEAFQIITLDFKNVSTVGQGFVDEVFRVYQTKNPNIKINYINENENILFMIKRGLART